MTKKIDPWQNLRIEQNPEQKAMDLKDKKVQEAIKELMKALSAGELGPLNESKYLNLMFAAKNLLNAMGKNDKNTLE